MEKELYIQELFFENLKRIKKQNSYLKNRIKQFNTNTGEILPVSTYEAQQKAYIKTTEQKVNALVAMALFEGLIVIFFTLTLPSRFHPTRTLKNGRLIRNKNYKYVNLEDAIKEGYLELKTIYRIFYKRAKNISKNIYFIKVFECHKSLIPHVHVLFFIEKDKVETIKKLFFKVCNEHDLKRVDFDESLLVDNIENAVGYIMKYILKTLNSKDEYYKIWLEGWRKKHKIRACEMSNLPISVEVYKKIYYNLPTEIKANIQKEIEENNQSFFQYFINNCEVNQLIRKEEEMGD